MQSKLYIELFRIIVWKLIVPVAYIQLMTSKCNEEIMLHLKAMKKIHQYVVP